MKPVWSEYLVAQCCTACTWVEKPVWPPYPSHRVCPDCGNSLIEYVGRWEVLRNPSRGGFFSRPFTEYIRFVRKDSKDGPIIPQPQSDG